MSATTTATISTKVIEEDKKKNINQQQQLLKKSLFDIYELEEWLEKEGCIGKKKQKKKEVVSQHVVTQHKQRIYRNLYNYIHNSSSKNSVVLNNSDDNCKESNNNQIENENQNKIEIINDKKTGVTNKQQKDDDVTSRWDIHNVPDLRHSVYDQFDYHYFPNVSNDCKSSINNKSLTTSTVIDTKLSKHGGKLIIQLQDKYQIETVIIRHVQNNTNSTGSASTSTSTNNKERYTVCVSSQVGCKMGCTFCATGTMRFGKNVTYYEIIEQIYHATITINSNNNSNTCTSSNKHNQPSKRISNIVFMGMGEPLDNYTNVQKAISSISQIFFHIPLNRITLSTVGIPDSIIRLSNDLFSNGTSSNNNNKNNNSNNNHVRLALSLHAPNDKIRKKIVPTAKKFPLQQIMDSIRYYQTFNNTNMNTATGADTIKQQRCVMIEYIMIDTINSSIDNAYELRTLLQNCNCIVNLIPYNPTSAGDRFKYTCPNDTNIIAFQQVLVSTTNTSTTNTNDQHPIQCTIRWSSRRGQNIDAACGQLVLQKQNIIIESSTNDTSCTKTSGHDIEDLIVVKNNSTNTNVGVNRIKRITNETTTSGSSEDVTKTDSNKEDEEYTGAKTDDRSTRMCTGRTMMMKIMIFGGGSVIIGTTIGLLVGLLSKSNDRKTIITSTTTTTSK